MIYFKFYPIRDLFFSSSTCIEKLWRLLQQKLLSCLRFKMIKDLSFSLESLSIDIDQKINIVSITLFLYPFRNFQKRERLFYFLNLITGWRLFQILFFETFYPKSIFLFEKSWQLLHKNFSVAYTVYDTIKDQASFSLESAFIDRYWLRLNIVSITLFPYPLRDFQKKEKAI